MSCWEVLIHRVFVLVWLRELTCNFAGAFAAAQLVWWYESKMQFRAPTHCVESCPSKLSTRDRVHQLAIQKVQLPQASPVETPRSRTNAGVGSWRRSNRASIFMRLRRVGFNKPKAAVRLYYSRPLPCSNFCQGNHCPVGIGQTRTYACSQVQAQARTRLSS